MKKILKIHTKRIIRILFVAMVLLMYAGLMLWTGKKVYAQISDADPYENLKHHIMNGQQTVASPKLTKIIPLGRLKENIEEIEVEVDRCEEEVKEKEDLLWFMRYFNPEIEAQWTSANLEVDEMTLKWWRKMKMRKETEVDIYTDEIMRKLFSIGLPNVNLYSRSVDEKAHKCRRCAVVGKSASKEDFSHAQFINSHDFVIRMGGKNAENYEANFGTKTTHLFFTTDNFQQTPSQQASCVFLPLAPQELKWFLNAIENKIQFYCNLSKSFVVHPQFISYIHKNWLNEIGTQPSLELISLVYALHECDETNLFGFSDAQGITNTIEGRLDYNYFAESSIIQELSLKKFIRVYD